MRKISIVKLPQSNTARLEYLLCSLILLSKQTIFTNNKKELPFYGPLCPQRLPLAEMSGLTHASETPPLQTGKKREPEMKSDLPKVTSLASGGAQPGFLDLLFRENCLPIETSVLVLEAHDSSSESYSDTEQF